MVMGTCYNQVSHESARKPYQEKRLVFSDFRGVHIVARRALSSRSLRVCIERTLSVAIFDGILSVGSLYVGYPGEGRLPKDRDFAEVKYSSSLRRSGGKREKRRQTPTRSRGSSRISEPLLFLLHHLFMQLVLRPKRMPALRD